jgi:general secretion pathway protein A
VYTSFYGLREPPFHNTPDPRFLYRTAAHGEALAQLEYGVKNRRGFLVLTGEVGTGKTTLLRALLERFDAETEVAYVFNPLMPFDEILEYVLEDFGITAAGPSRAQRLFALNRFLIERHRRGLNTVVIIDEAQHLDTPALEQVRLLSNFETATNKLIQILLVGQPELKTKLALPELRQLRQRISLRCTIRALTFAQTADYIRHRLTIARGGYGEDIFTKGAVGRIADYSQGSPRTINMVCDHCLLTGYADQKRIIDRDTVEEVIDYLEEREKPVKTLEELRNGASKRSASRWVVPTTTALAFGVACVALSGSGDEIWGRVTSDVADFAHRAGRWIEQLVMVARDARS